MSVPHSVDDQGRYDGRSLSELWPAVVDEVVRAVAPLEVILFGSVARGEDGPDSDIDLLVVFDHIDRAQKRPMMARIRSAIETLLPWTWWSATVRRWPSAAMMWDRSCTGQRVKAARCIGGRVPRPSDPLEWLTFRTRSGSSLVRRSQRW
jgi:predicted nucleotidyltransferase